MKIYSLFLCALLLCLSIFGFRPLTSLYAYNLNASIFQISIITGCYSLGPLFVGVFIGRYVDKFGEKIPIAIGSCGIFFSIILPILFPVITTLYFSQIILGICQVLIIVAIQNGIANIATNNTRDKALGNFSLFNSIGMLLGPLIGGLVAEHFGFIEAFIILALSPLISLILLRFIQIPDRRHVKIISEKQSSIYKLLSKKDLRKTIIVSMLSLAALDIFYAYFPLYGSEIGLSVSQVGIMLSLLAFSNILVRIFLDRLIISFGKIRILFIFMLFGSFGYGLVYFFNNIYLLGTLIFLFGIGLGVTQPLTIILTYSLAPKNQTAEVLSIRLVSNRFAQLTIPLVFANISGSFGLGIVFLLQGILLGGGSFLAKSIKEEED